MSETQTLFIDDTDSVIVYTGNWIPDQGSLDNIGNGGAPYLSTTHFIMGTGSFSYTFSGTYVGIFGSSVDDEDPSRTCTVDGTVIPNNVLASATNQQLHCQVDGLPDGQHTIVVTVSTANPQGYWFDFISYIPSASVSKANAVLSIENGDPSMNFGSGWSQDDPGMSTSTNGATFSLMFTGKTLTWRGFYLSQHPFASTTATWSVDGSSPKAFTLNGTASQTTGGEFNQIFFTTGLLSEGQHTLNVVYNGNDNTTPLSVYDVVIQDGTSARANGIINTGGSVSKPPTSSAMGGNGNPSNMHTAQSGTPTPGSPSSSTVRVIGTGTAAVTITVSGNSSATFYPIGPPATSAISRTQSSTATSTATSGATPGSGTLGNDAANHAVSSGEGHSHTGAIVGAVIGGLVAIILLLLIVFLLRRKRQNRTAVVPPRSKEFGVAVDPFTDAPRTFPSPHMMTAKSPSTMYAPSISPSAQVRYTNATSMYASTAASQHLLLPPSQQEFPDEKRRQLQYHVPSSSFSTFSSPTSTEESPGIIMRHEDSGVRMDGAGVNARVLEMPPQYSAD